MTYIHIYVGRESITGKQDYITAAVNSLKDAKLKHAQLTLQVANSEIVPIWEREQPKEHYTFDMAYKACSELYKQKGL